MPAELIVIHIHTQCSLVLCTQVVVSVCTAAFLWLCTCSMSTAFTIIIIIILLCPYSKNGSCYSSILYYADWAQPTFRIAQHGRAPWFRAYSGLCLNCLRSWHFAKNCRSLNHCQNCQKLHHTLLHQPQETTISSERSLSTNPSPIQLPSSESVACASNTSMMRISPNVLLMTCRVLVVAPDGSTVNARTLLDSGSTVSFISEWLAQVLRLPRSQQQATIYGVAGLAHWNSVQSIATFVLSPTNSTHKEMSVTAVIVPRVTCLLSQCNRTLNGSICQVYNLLIQTWAHPVRLTYYLE